MPGDGHPSKQRAVALLERVDEVIYGIIAVFLVITAFLTFNSVSLSIIDYFNDSDSRHTAVVILDKLILTLMVLEVLYTIRLSFHSHTLSAEPFLVVGIFAAIRRILVISVESHRRAGRLYRVDDRDRGSGGACPDVRRGDHPAAEEQSAPGDERRKSVGSGHGAAVSLVQIG